MGDEMNDDAIAEALREIARALVGLDRTIFDVFGSEKVGRALEQIALGSDISVSVSLDDVAKAIRERG